MHLSLRLARRNAVTPLLACLIAGSLALPAGAASPAALGAAPDAQAKGLYGENMRDTLAGDAQLQRILRQNGVTKPMKVELVVEPDGEVAKAGMLRSAAPHAAEDAVINYLLTLHFGHFYPDMPDKALVFLLPVAPAEAGSTVAEPAFRATSVALYEPQTVLEARLGSTAAFNAYIRQLADRLAAVFVAAPAGPGASAALVVGIKPGDQTRFWVVEHGDALSPALVTQIKAAAADVPAIPVRGGPIAFAILFNAWGGGPPVTDSAHPIPIPPAWLAGSTGKEQVPDGVFARIWPSP
ncbi:MAG: hypothetical protein B7Z81_02540 [Acidocella sp. 20-61-6]|nr:MAG: hypothetical protein B7Z81_02540 [Acidocella sp. 20-61-6]